MSNFSNDWKRGWNSRIARRFVFSTVLCSSILALLITGIQLYADYRSDVSALNRDIENIEVSRLPSLVESVWSIDETLIESQLQGILQVEGVKYVAVEGNDNKIEFGQDGDYSSKLYYSYPLTRAEGSRIFELGELKVVISLDHVYDRLIAKGISLLIANSVKTFLVAMFIIFIYQMMIGRHLSNIAQFARKHDPENPEEHLSLGRTIKYRDELEDLEIAFNQWIENQIEHVARYRRYNEEIERRRDELSNANEELNRANEELTQFAYSASHDLKAPLTSIVGLLGFAEKDVDAGEIEQALFAIRASKEEADKLASRIEEMLTLAKSEQANNDWEEIEIEKTIENIWPIMQTAFPEKESVLVTEYLHRDAPVSVKVRMQLVLENLLSNSLKYASDERDVAVVTVKTFNEGDNFVLSVSDNGIGIPEKFHDKVFQVFQRFANSQKPSSGLGLSIVKKNVKQLGGDISFTSTPDGTTFTILLPQGQTELAKVS